MHIKNSPVAYTYDDKFSCYKNTTLQNCLYFYLLDRI
jgi:hypothetical protein